MVKALFFDNGEIVFDFVEVGGIGRQEKDLVGRGSSKRSEIVVVMECGGRKFVIPDNNYGLISKKFDVDDMASKIRILIENKDLAYKIANNGRKYIIKKFRIKNVAEKIYKSLVE